MEPILNLTHSEYEIMEFLWQQENPVTLQEVIAYCNNEKQHTWKQQTIYTFLSRLEHKDVVSAEKKGQKRYYSAALTHDQLKTRAVHQLLKDNFNNSLKTFLAAFTGNQDLSDEDKALLKEFLK